MDILTKNRLIMQFHVTGRCNLNCKHCYREDSEEILSYEQITDCIEQFIRLKNIYNQKNKIKKRGHINITGGEPFIRNDIRDIIEFLYNQQNEVTYGVLTNGSYLDEDTIELLKKTNVSFVQLSIDGTRKIHDELRKPGDYDRVFSVAEKLVKKGIKTHISFTANKKNYFSFPEIAKECRKRKITKLWSDRFVPIGNGEALNEYVIDNNCISDYVKCLKKAEGGFLKKLIWPDTKVARERALQFIGIKDGIYSCGAGKRFFTVDEKGNVMPCRRLPIICGNIRDNSIEDIFYKNEVFKFLQKDSIPKECMECKYAAFCKGGAKCQAYAVNKKLNCADFACNLKNNLN